MCRAASTARSCRSLFQEGQDVTQGDVLAIIDPRPLQAQLEQQIASAQEDQALLDGAILDMKRYDTLVLKDFATPPAGGPAARAGRSVPGAGGQRRGADRLCAKPSSATPRSARRSAGASASARSTRAISCTAGDRATIVMITQLQPISVVFTLAAAAVGQTKLTLGQVNVPVIGAAVRTMPRELDRGVINLVDNQVDQSTGTIKLKASFPNLALKLWPGNFVNGRITVDIRRNAVTVAADRGPARPARRFCLGGEAGPDRGVSHRRGRPGVRRPRDDRSRRWPRASRSSPRAITVWRTAAASRSIDGRAKARRAKRADRDLRTRLASDVSALHPAADRHDAVDRRHRAARACSATALLPVAPLPSVEFPTIQVVTPLPRRSPDVVETSITAPLEHYFGSISGLSSMRSTSSYGNSQITLQFDLSRKIDAAAQDVQAQINAAAGWIPIEPAAGPADLSPGQSRRHAGADPRADLATRCRCTRSTITPRP